MPTDPLKLAALMAQAISAAPNVGSATWQREIERIIARGHMAAWMAGTAERLGVPVDSPLLSQVRLSRAERREIQGVVDVQLRYFRGFQADMKDMTPAQIAARAQLYAGATRATYSSKRWGDWQLPYQPGQGTECLSQCRCHWEVQDNGDGTGTAVWHLGATERHCVTCPARASQSPYSVKRRAA